MAALAMVGCGSATSSRGGGSTATRVGSAASSSPASPTPRERSHPQVVEPVAGQVGSSRTSTQKPRTRTASPQTPDPAPSKPASVSCAPANGAPSDAEVRIEIARFQLAVARYHLDRLHLSSALLDPAQLPAGLYNTSIASVFTDYGLPIACGGVLHVPQLGVANKTLPCGTEVIFRYGGRAIRVPVLDRGP